MARCLLYYLFELEFNNFQSLGDFIVFSKISLFCCFH